QLLDEARHLAYLDAFAQPAEEKAAYAAAYEKYRGIKKEIGRLSMDELERERLTESLQYQIKELEAAQLREGEEEELASRRDRMKNAEKLTEAVEEAYAALYDGEYNAISLASDAESFAGRAAAFAPELADAVKSIGDARFLLEDAAERLSDLRASLDFSPEEYDNLESRLSLLRRLERKYGLDEAGLIARLEEDRQRLDTLEGSGDLLLQLEKDLKKARTEVLAAGEKLSARRRAAAAVLAERIAGELKYLNMPSVRFVAEISPLTGGDGFDATGCDDVRFLMSANAGEEPGRIAKIASGGELSRIMLAMKTVFAQGDGVQSLIFDEIDTGVSGIAAQRVGEKIGALSAQKQIICVTHLPQIAAMADTHFRISKSEEGGRTYTKVTPLDHDGRLHELARLHGGDVVTETTLRSAEEQLAAAQRFKASHR
ncbi:MAG: DNA repair protein RecN, partial [Oscillospiraceae bacterium]